MERPLMKLSSARWRWSLGPALGVALLAPGGAGADTHYAIVSAVRSSPRAAARINVATPQITAVTFRVFGPGGEYEDTLVVSPDLFVTSASSTTPEIQNLFTASEEQSLLVRIEVPAVSSSAMLEQSSLDGRVVLNVPPLEAAWGSAFDVPIGDLHDGTVLLVGNPNSEATAVVIRYGNGADEVAGVVPARGVLAIPVTRADMLLRVKSANPAHLLIVNLAVDTGRTTEITYLTPITPGQ